MKKIFLAAGACVFLFGCSQTKKEASVSVQSAVSPEKKVTVGFSIDTLAIERWQRDLDTFMAAARELEADVIVQNAGNSVERQKKQLMYLVDRNVDVIVVLPKEASSLKDEIEKIRAKSIPVISYDRLLTGVKIDLYVTVDSCKVGALMGEHLQRIAGAKNWLCILGPQEDYNMEMIQKGIAGAVQDSSHVIREVFFTQDWNYDLSRQKMIDVVTGGNLPDAIVCGNDAVADSVISVLRLYYPDRHIPVCGQDADIAACQNIMEGFQDFTVYKPIVALAQIAAEYSVRIARGEKASSLPEAGQLIDNGSGMIPAVMLEPCIVTKETIDELIIGSGFHTHGEVHRE